MTRVVYINGQYLPYDQAMVHVEDRGFQFSDGVYEVVAIVAGKIIDIPAHLDRLDYSLKAIAMNPPLPREAFAVIIQEIAHRNRLANGIIYLQITRGVAPRSFGFPKSSTPTVVASAQYFDFENKQDELPLRVITTEDIRWRRPDIKSICLLGNVLSKQKAIEAGAFEAILMDGDIVTEGSSSSLWIVNAKGVLQTHPVGRKILSGLTRLHIVQLCQQNGIPMEEKPFTLEEFYQAQEAFLTSTSVWVAPIGQVNEKIIGTGLRGPITAHLQQLYRNYLYQ